MSRAGRVDGGRSYRGWRVDPWIGVAALIVVLGRAPFLWRAPSPDEAGYLVVGGGWSRGTSLYGDYWVDRPPLLVDLFGLAARAGGVLPLRILGIAASVATVLLVAWAVRSTTGGPGARWAALAAAALCVSPALGGQIVNGELLAAPFVALGVGAAVAALSAPEPRRVLGWSGLAGAAGACAAMVKQNLVDVLVFGTALLLVHLVTRSTTVRTAAQVVAGVAGGGVAALGLISAAAVARGTGLRDLVYAMYGFRIDASAVIADEALAAVDRRRAILLDLWLVNGPALLTVVLVAGLLWWRLREPVLVALAVTVAYDGWSVVMGSGYWNHYLLQLVVPLSIALGVVAARLPRRAWFVPVLVVASLAVASVVAVLNPDPPERSVAAQAVGRSIARVAEPGDTLTVVYGGGQVQFASGLSSPYPYLWGLPLRTLDPDLEELEEVLRGPRAPTWFVVATKLNRRGQDRSEVHALLDERYRRVATLKGHSIYLLDGTDRPVPTVKRRIEAGSPAVHR